MAHHQKRVLPLRAPGNRFHEISALLDLHTTLILKGTSLSMEPVSHPFFGIRSQK